MKGWHTSAYCCTRPILAGGKASSYGQGVSVPRHTALRSLFTPLSTPSRNHCRRSEVGYVRRQGCNPPVGRRHGAEDFARYHRRREGARRPRHLRVLLPHGSGQDRCHGLLQGESESRVFPLITPKLVRLSSLVEASFLSEGDIYGGGSLLPAGPWIPIGPTNFQNASMSYHELTLSLLASLNARTCSCCDLIRPDVFCLARVGLRPTIERRGTGSRSAIKAGSSSHQAPSKACTQRARCSRRRRASWS